MERLASQQSQPRHGRPLGSMPADPQLYLAVVGGVCVAWGISVLVPGSPTPIESRGWLYLQLLLLFPLLEEILFRGLLQGWLTRGLSGRVGPLSHANLLTSLLFATAHLYNHPATWALATFAPSLLFGYFRDRYRHVLPAVVLHVVYNSAFFWFQPR